MALEYPRKVTVYEVGPRDGLQNEKVTVPTEVKVKYIDLLADSGLSVIEATSFVSPRAIPQLADATDVMRQVERKPGVRYPVLVPNARGMERALEAGVSEIALFTAASESFTRANINSSIAESLENFRAVAKIAKEHDVKLRAYVSTAFGCPYQGFVAPGKVREVALALFDLGAYQVSLGDTIGVGTPNQVEDVAGPLITEVGADAVAVHFHDTRGTALANVLAALDLGISTLDASSGGLGGCPYAPGASGNLATEDLVYMLNGMGVETGVDLDRLAQASRFILSALGRESASKYLQTCPA